MYAARRPRRNVASVEPFLPMESFLFFCEKINGGTRMSASIWERNKNTGACRVCLTKRFRMFATRDCSSLSFAASWGKQWRIRAADILVVGCIRVLKDDVACGVRCAVCSVWCAVCGVRCAVCWFCNGE